MVVPRLTGAYMERAAPPFMLGFLAGFLPVLAVGLAYAVARWLHRRRCPPGHCQKCGYNLTGNVSGRCPECGTLIAATAEDR